MLFTTLGFLIFLIVVLGVFILLPASLKGAWLLVASLGHYATFGIENLVYLGSVIGLAWGAGVLLGRVHRRRLILGGALSCLIGGLFALKFYDFLVAELEQTFGLSLPFLGQTAPVGFSFYVFMASAYLIDVYRRDVAGEARLDRVALYLSWFPKILAGPIERAGPFFSDVPARLRFDPLLATVGLQLVLWGLFKKVVIADNLSPVVDHAFAIAPYAAPMELLIAVYFFAFQIYCDFSGYSDIAIGLSLFFGVRLMQNFRRPYLAASTREYWASRWHISLGQWFRDYFYLPLGGSRGSRLRHAVNVMTVFLVSGLWHAGLGYGVGWTFLVWGALNGVYQWVGMATSTLWEAMARLLPDLAGSSILHVLRVIFTFHLILISWIFFRAESVGQALVVIERIVGALPTLPGLLPTFPFSPDHIAGFILISLLIVVEVIDERQPMVDRLALAPRLVSWSAFYACLFGLLLLGRWRSEGFIYMQF